jgi:protein-S-isoprenylcysteine O-methyltransferase
MNQYTIRYKTFLGVNNMTIEIGNIKMNFLVLLPIIIWLTMFIYWVIRSKSKGILNEIVGLIKLFVSGLVLFIPAFLPFEFLTYKSLLSIQIIGLVIMIFGFIVCIMAREYLSKNWSGRVTIQEKHELIKKGPYKKIRHPIYFGVLVMMLGSSIIIGNLIDFIWVLFSFFGLYRKSKQEEKLLEKEFGGIYGQYKKETKMIIPYIL